MAELERLLEQVEQSALGGDWGRAGSALARLRAAWDAYRAGGPVVDAGSVVLAGEAAAVERQLGRLERDVDERNRNHLLGVVEELGMVLRVHLARGRGRG
jgi:hypothetical protein